MKSHTKKQQLGYHRRCYASPETLDPPQHVFSPNVRRAGSIVGLMVDISAKLVGEIMEILFQIGPEWINQRSAWISNCGGGAGVWRNSPLSK